MTNQCLDEGVLQSYLDGELSPVETNDVALHLAHCALCTAAMRESEDELDFFAGIFCARSQTPVPSESLRARLDAAIAEQGTRHNGSLPHRAVNRVREWLAVLATSLAAVSWQHRAAFASLAAVAVFGVIFGSLVWRDSNTDRGTDVSHTTTNTAPTPVVESSSITTEQASVSTTGLNPKPGDAPIQRLVPGDVQAVNRAIISHRNPTRVNRTLASEARHNVKATDVALLPGEGEYLRTINSLSKVVERGGDESLRPALRADYERNVAVIDKAISETRRAVRRNPKDRDAAEFLFAAYQNKIDLMNAVADQPQVAAIGR
ncbi:MAG: zf-HC2 domain-containing protein [Acidobacteriota bacterium]|nr:zf-HC2 domain-containing protein [Acidobacteriota bacterium]